MTLAQRLREAGYGPDMQPLADDVVDVRERSTLRWYYCPTHQLKWSAAYLHEHGRLGSNARICQREGCVLQRVVTDPSDTITLRPLLMMTEEALP